MSHETWPFPEPGIIESVIATRQPDGEWNLAAIGIRPAESGGTAKTWGETRTRSNLIRNGTGYVQIVKDPVLFTHAALERWTRSDPILDSASAWAKIRVTQIDSGTVDETEWVEWSLTPETSEIRERVVPSPSRGFAAVIEMTIAASRLGCPGFHDEELRGRLRYFADVARSCGGPDEQAAVEQIFENIGTVSGCDSEEWPNRTEDPT